MDIRPFASRLRSGEKYSISVGDHIQWTSKLFEIDGEKYVKNFAYLLVYNNSRTGKTAKNVRVRKYPVGAQHDAPTRDGKVCADMHHGEQEWFLLGSLISRTSYGWFEFDEEISEEDRETTTKSVAFGSYAFMIARKSSIGLQYRGVKEEDLLANPMSLVIVRVSAQDTPTLQVDLQFDRQKLERGDGETNFQSPIRVSEVKKL